MRNCSESVEVRVPEMKAARRIGFFLYFLWVSAAMWISRQKLLALFDPVSNHFFHKSLSQRSEIIQIIFIFTAALLVSYLIWFFIRKVKNTKWLRLVCIAVSAVLIGIICWNQTLRRDDYWEIRDAYKYGFPGYIIFEYTNVCGRYFSQFLKSLYQFFPQTEYINTLLIVTFVLLCAGCVLLLKTVLKRSQWVDLLSGGFCAALGVIFISPNLWEAWFWSSATFVYGTGFALILIAMGSMISEIGSSERSLRKTIIAAFCIFCACGTSELNAASVCALTFFVLFFSFLFKKETIRMRMVFLMLLAWSLTIIIFLTSGDLKGADEVYHGGYSSFSAVLSSLRGNIISSVLLILQYSKARIEFLLLFSVLGFLTGFCAQQQPLSVNKKVLAAVVLSLIITAVISLTINTMIGYIPPRVLSIPLGWLLLAVMFLMLCLGAKVHQRFFATSPVHGLPVLIPLVLLTVSVIFYQNNIGMICDIRSAWLERDRILSEMNGSEEPVKTCAIPVMGSSMADPGKDPDWEFNIVTAYYYGFPSVTADHLCAPFGDR